MTEKIQQIEHYLFEVEVELRRLNYWQEGPPTADALSSELPFCHDTLKFTQWLQFVFLRRMKMLLESSAKLPSVCGIAPYAEEYFKTSNDDVSVLLEHLKALDKLLTTN